MRAALESLSGITPVQAAEPGTPRNPDRLLRAPAAAEGASLRASLRWRGAFQAQALSANLERTREAEGSDAVLFRHVPQWIRYRKIEGCRYRLVTTIVDPVDPIDSMHDNVTFLGFPGASGWADRVGSVALHYRGKDWFLFSKILPFREQRGEIDEHEDMLLLGAAKHVMMVPECIYRAPEPLGAGSSRVATIKSQGIAVRQTVVSRLSPFALRRAYLSWGHPQTGFAERVAPLQRVTHEELQQRMGSCSLRFLSHLRCLADQALGLLQARRGLATPSPTALATPNGLASPAPGRATPAPAALAAYPAPLSSPATTAPTTLDTTHPSTPHASTRTRARALTPGAVPGRRQVEEKLARYPHEPVDPRYYEWLLASASRQVRPRPRRSAAAPVGRSSLHHCCPPSRRPHFLWVPRDAGRETRRRACAR